VIPLFKEGSGSKRINANDYRPITLTSCVSKLFEAMLLGRLSDWSNKMKKLVEEQCGFRIGRSTMDQIFTLHELLAHKRESRGIVYMAFLDARRAYDTVWRDGLLFKLAQAGIRGRMFSVLHSMLSRTTRRVVVNGFESEEFTTSVGLPQGAVLSPLLYALFINGLAEQLKQQNLGMLYCDRRIGILLYADDIVLLAETPEQLQRMLDIASQYASQWQFKFNTKPGKSNVVICPHSEHERYTNFFKLSGAPLEVTEHYKYLGLEMGQVSRDCWKPYCARILARAGRALKTLRYGVGGRRALPLATVTHLFKTLVRPLLEYGIAMWGAMTQQAVLTLLENVQVRFGRWLLRVPSKTATEFVRRELGLQSMAERAQLASFKLFHKLCKMPQERLPAFIFRHRLHKIDRDGPGDSWCSAMHKSLAAAGELQVWHKRDVPDDWLQRMKRKLHFKFLSESDQTVEHKSTLTLFRHLGPASRSGLLKTSLHHPGAQIRMKLRCDALPLMSRVGAQAKMAPDARICKFCHAAVENAEHFACKCTLFDDLRKECQSRLRGACHKEISPDLQQAIDNFDVALILGDKWQEKLSPETRKTADTVICCYLKLAWRRREANWKTFCQPDNAWKLRAAP
jgi:hypothetical protein